MVWILLVLLYGLLKGSREISKKKAMDKNSVMEVLFTYTLISFILVIPQVKNAGGMELRFYFYIALKSFFIFIAWICGFKSLKRLPVSVYGILDLSRVLFATFLGVIVLGEKLNYWQIAGLIIVCAGLLLLRFKPLPLRRLFNVQEDSLIAGNPSEHYGKNTYAAVIYISMALISCILNAVSGLMDKILMKDLNSSQLQFWYMLYLVLLYLGFILVRRIPLHLSALKNKWIWILSILFVIADKALFVANGYPESRVSVMTLLKQAGCIVTIFAGRFLFKEKNTGHKLFCAAIIIAGITLGSV